MCQKPTTVEVWLVVKYIRGIIQGTKTILA